MPRVTVAPERVTVRPGENTEVEVTVQNTGKSVEHFDASIVGLPGDEHYECRPPTVKLRPGETGTVLVNLGVPERPAPDAGLYTLGVLIRSPYQRHVSRCEELRLDVQPAPGISIEAQPEVVNGGPTASYGLRLANDGNTALDITLQGSDPEGRVAFYFRPRSVRVAPNASAPAELTVRAPAPWSGQEARRTLTIKATAGTDLSAERHVTFVQKPRIPRGPVRFIGIATAVAILAGATLAGALVRNAADNKSNPQQSQQGLPPGPPIVIPGLSSTPAQPPASSPAASASGGKAPSAAVMPPGSVVLDPAQPPDGQPPQDRPIPSNLWAASGVTLSVNLEHAGPACADATGLALRKTTQYGAFLTSARPAGTSLCNTMPIRVVFAAPVRRVQVTYLTKGGAAYQLLVQEADGTVRAQPPATPPAATETTFDYTAPGTTAITAIQFGHASPDPNATDPTIIKRIVFVAAEH
jgi:hypothetical protein